MGLNWPKPTAKVDSQVPLNLEMSPSLTEQEKILQQTTTIPSETDETTRKYGLGHCNIWVGTALERTATDASPPAALPLSEDLPSIDNGIMLIYLPLLPNPALPGVDPATTDFLSTWNFAYTPEQVDQVVWLAEHNFAVGKERIRRAVGAMWRRKKMEREQKEVEWLRRLHEMATNESGW
jgi:cytosolic phospholipase A2